MKHRPPSTVPLLLECDGDTTPTTWGEFLADNRHDRDVCRAGWRVVTRTVEQVVFGGGAAPMVTVRRGEG